MKDINQLSTIDYEQAYFYESEITYQGRPIRLFDLDEHQNRETLAKQSFMIEYFTKDYECLILPKNIANKLHYTNDNVLQAHFLAQETAQTKLMKSKFIIQLITLLFIVLIILSTLRIIALNPYATIISYVLFYLYTNFIYRTNILQTSYQSVLNTITKEVPISELKNNINDINEEIVNKAYFSNKTKLLTVKHFNMLLKLLTRMENKKS